MRRAAAGAGLVVAAGELGVAYKGGSGLGEGARWRRNRSPARTLVRVGGGGARAWGGGGGNLGRRPGWVSAQSARGDFFKTISPTEIKS